MVLITKKNWGWWGGWGWGWTRWSITWTLSNQTDLQTALDGKINVGGALVSLNWLTWATQTFAVGTAGTNFNIVSLGTVHTFNIPGASATSRGALSSTDWSTFNGKFTLPAFTAGSVLFSDGTTIAQSNTNFNWNNTTKRLTVSSGNGNLTFYTDASYQGIITNTNGNIFIGNNQTIIRGAGATSATFATIIQNVAGTQIASFRNDGRVSLWDLWWTVLIGWTQLTITGVSNTATFNTAGGNFRFNSTTYGERMSWGAVNSVMTFFWWFTSGHPTSGKRVIAHFSGGALQSAPTTNVADSYQIYAADVGGVDGTTAMHTRAENGTVIKHYQETTAVASATVASPGAWNVIKTDDTFDWYTLAQIVRWLRLKWHFA